MKEEASFAITAPSSAAERERRRMRDKWRKRGFGDAIVGGGSWKSVERRAYMEGKEEERAREKKGKGAAA